MLARVLTSLAVAAAAAAPVVVLHWLMYHCSHHQRQQ
jgi:hypothetical protein